MNFSLIKNSKIKDIFKNNIKQKTKQNKTKKKKKKKKKKK